MGLTQSPFLGEELCQKFHHFALKPACLKVHQKMYRCHFVMGYLPCKEEQRYQERQLQTFSAYKVQV